MAEDAATAVSPPVDTMADRVVLGMGYIHELEDPDALRDASSLVRQAVLGTGARHVMPGSRHSESLVTATVLFSDGKIERASDRRIRDGDIDKVVVVEASAVTGYLVRRTVESIRSAGADWVGLVLLHDAGTHRPPPKPNSSSHEYASRFGQPDDLTVINPHRP